MLTNNAAVFFCLSSCLMALGKDETESTKSVLVDCTIPEHRIASVACWWDPEFRVGAAEASQGWTEAVRGWRG